MYTLVHFGAVAGYAIKKLIKLAAIIVGLFIVALAYLSYKGWLDVKWIPIENAAKSTLTEITNQAIKQSKHLTIRHRISRPILQR